MAASKEHLKLLLEFISKILEQEGNEWFHDELALLISKKIILEKDAFPKISAVTIKEYGSINKYIEQGLIPIIDYSKINDKKVRYQLERDSIEMGKYRISNFAYEISFVNFCKYAHFQAEELVNYYFYTITNGDLNKIKKLIKDYNKKFTEEGKSFDSLSSIPYNIKVYSVKNIFSIPGFHFNILLNIGKIRNNNLHRNSNQEKDDEKLEEFIKKENYNSIYETLEYLKNKVIENVQLIYSK